MNDALKKGGAIIIIGVVFTGLTTIIPPFIRVFELGAAYSKVSNRIDKVEQEVEIVQGGIGDIMVVLCDPSNSKERGKLADEVCIKRLKGRR